MPPGACKMAQVSLEHMFHPSGVSRAVDKQITTLPAGM